VAQRVPPDDPFAAATSLGEFLAALHQPAPPDAPENRFRGVPLTDRDATMHERVAQLADAIDARAVLARWDELLATPPWSGPPLWLHGDLHPANVLVHRGRLSAVIDFGDITSGDPANDLSVAWMLFPPDARATFRAAAGAVDDDTWARARGWALTLAVTYIAASANDPVIEREGHEAIAAVLADS
jgi:aminoglycoside phosphotransferase (APT) family kinase protein